MGEVSDEVTRKLLETLQNLERRISIMPDRSWTLNDCADFMQCSYSTAYRMSKQAGFPKPSKPQTNDKGSRMEDRYHPDEFTQWFYSRANRAS